MNYSTAHSGVDILIVEDSVTQALQLQHILEQHGYGVSVAHNGKAALEALRRHPPTMVISDIVMPEMDGYELCQQIKTDEQLRDIPVILLTGLSDPKDMVRGLQCGADNFIVKPYDAQVLLARIQYILTNQELRQHTRTQMGIEVFFAGQRHSISAERIQIIDLLFSTYEAAIQKNLALTQAREEAEQAREEAERAREEAEQAREEAERANQAKSDFLSRMSHELRTPLNAILGFGQLLEMDDLPPQQQSEVGHIVRAGNHLLALVDEVLDIARIEAGRMTLSLEPVSVSEVVQEAMDLVQPLATTRGLRLHQDETCRRRVVADRQRLKQVLLNLLSNTAKYSNERSEVLVRCVETATAGGTATAGETALDGHAAPPARLRISVRDSGPGIAPDKLARLFVPFDRLGAEQTGIEGTGIGLALAKRLVELMGGTITVQSSVGQGSTFSVELALAEDEMEQPVLDGEEAASPEPRGNSLPHKTVLYIEDNLPNLHLIEAILTHRPEVRLLSAMQGSLGLDMARQHNPHLILLDVHLPDMSGDEVLHRLRADAATSATPVVGISADATPQQIERLRAAGAMEYLTKPLDVKRFLAVLDQTLRQGQRAPA